jgi:hypothetical protein
MGLIPTSKFGDCVQCGAKDTNVVKVKKETFCLLCHRSNKTKQQVTKANQKTAVRGLMNYQRENGIVSSIQELVIDLDRVVSRYVRLRDMGKDGKCSCFTCSARKVWTAMQNGHFIPRANLALRFDTTYNCQVQCPNCNVTLYGNLDAFSANLEKLQPGIVEQLQEQARQVYSPTKDELKQMLFDYQMKLKIVEAKLKQ